jgi:hypothetical protein
MSHCGWGRQGREIVNAGLASVSLEPFRLSCCTGVGAALDGLTENNEMAAANPSAVINLFIGKPPALVVSATAI